MNSNGISWKVLREEAVNSNVLSDRDRLNALKTKYVPVFAFGISEIKDFQARIMIEERVELVL